MAKKVKVSLPILAALPPEMLRNVLEYDFQYAVVAYARERGWLIHFTHYSTTQLKSGRWVGTAQAGWPDLFGIRGTHAIGWELKTETGRVRPEQQAWIDAMSVAGIQTGIYRPHQAAEIMERLK